MFSKFREEHRRIADYARKLVQAPPVDKELNGSCWTSAYAAMRRAGAITRPEERRLVMASSAGSLDVLGPNPQPITTLAEFLAIPAGKVVAFVRPRGPGAPNTLSHVALSMGAGNIAGTNNTSIGGSPHWSITALNAIVFQGGQAQIADIGGVMQAYSVYLIPFTPVEQQRCIIM